MGREWRIRWGRNKIGRMFRDFWERGDDGGRNEER